MEFQQSATEIVFFQAPLAWWAIGLILLLPLLITSGALYYTFFKSDSGEERAFYLGFVLFSVPFFLIPYVAGEAQEGLKIAINSHEKRVNVSDDSGKTYSAPFQDFKAYAVQTSSKTDDEGRTRYEYSLELVRKTGATLHLYETGSKEKMQDLLSAVRGHLDRPVAGSLEGQMDLLQGLQPILAGFPSEKECLSDFSAIHAHYSSSDGCKLRWQTRLHPVFLPVLTLPFIATYFVVLLWRARGYSHKWIFALAISLLLFLAIGYGAARSLNSTSVVILEPQGPSIRAYVDSPYFGRFDERSMLLKKVAFVDAGLGEETAITLYDRNPLEGGLKCAAGALFSMESVMIYTDGLPATDRLLLADLLATSTAW